ncbi:MAG TPA: hypothetical protein VHM02_01480, partial [Thermoanaerobaculia bacterium]|nr:hypothetical protein [Thermoanaerobaculia bacterium]
GPEAPIVHDPEAAAELSAAFAALAALPSYRQTQQDLEPVAGEPQTVEHLGDGRMRMLQEDTAGPWHGTSETVLRPGRAAYRFTSPDLDAHLATLRARQRAATLVSVGSQIRDILQGAALGPMGLLQAGLSLAGTARGGLLGGLADEDLYGKWHCVDLPELPIPATAGVEGAEAAALPDGTVVERLPAGEIDGERVRGYRSETDSGGATLAYLTWVSEATGLPRRSELTIDMPGFHSRSRTDYETGGEVAAFEPPPCLDEGGGAGSSRP